MIVLALETSCDETAVAIMRDRELLVSEVASQTLLHEKYGGVVPEVASRNHLLYAPRLLESALAQAKVSLGEIDCFASTSGPGLATSLMVGASIAKGLALGRRKPYLAINHLEGHLLSPFFDNSLGAIARNVSLVVSGGHTLLVEVNGVADYRILGRTVDDAAGEAFDKVAKMLGLGYPGGPEIEKQARSGDAKRFDFPRSMLDSRDHNFSFSGLKTAVRYTLAKLPSPNEQTLADLCASFQMAVIEVLVRKTSAAAKMHKAPLVALSGGVSCNSALREQMQLECERAGLRFIAAPNALTTDNAAMIAFAAMLRFEQGLRSEVTEEIDPNLALA